MLKLKIFSLIILTSFLSVNAQSTYFNKQISPNNNWNIATSIVRDDSTYSLIARLGELNNQYHNIISFIKLDLNGNLISNNNYSDSMFHSFSGANGSLVKIDGGYILGAQKKAITNDSSIICLMRFDNNGDTLWTKDFRDTQYNRNWLMNAMVRQTPDGGFAMLGETYTGEYSTKFILIKTDSSGNEIWRNYYGYSGFYLDQNEPFKLICTPDGGYLMHGGSNYTSNANDLNSILIKADSFGNQQWIKNYGGINTEYYGSVAITNDSNYLLAINYNNDDSGSTINNLHLMKIDKNGNEIWTKTYLAPRHLFFVYSLINIEDGGYAAVGSTYNSAVNTFDTFAWIMRFDENGDSVWYHQYRNYWESRYIWHFLYDVVQTPDGGFAACGEIKDMDTGAFEDIWVLKLDSNGCRNKFCTVGINELGITKTSKLSVFPNPAYNEITISFENDISNKTRDIFIFDSMDRLIKTTQIPYGESEININIQSLDKGLYFIKTLSNNKIEISTKFIKL